MSRPVRGARVLALRGATLSAAHGFGWDRGTPIPIIRAAEVAWANLGGPTSVIRHPAMELPLEHRTRLINSVCFQQRQKKGQPSPLDEGEAPGDRQVDGGGSERDLRQ